MIALIVLVVVFGLGCLDLGFRIGRSVGFSGGIREGTERALRQVASW